MTSHRSPSQTPKVVYLDRESLPARINIPKPSAPHAWHDFARTVADQIIAHCQNATVVVTNKVPIDATVLDACPSIGHIAVTATGYNIIDLDACAKHGVSVSNIPSYAATTVAEHVLACTLSLRRQIIQYRQRVIDGAWQQSDTFCVFDKPINMLAGATLGVIGFGEIGRATAQMAAAMGMNVEYTSRQNYDVDFAQHVTLNDLLQRSDVVSVHCALNDDTHNLLDAPELAQMPDHAILINTARGGIVNEAAAASAIKSATLGGLAFDVLVQEPPQHSPLLEIADRSNVIITPHIAWASDEAMQTLANIVSDNVDAYLRGSPQNLVSHPIKN
ncbi:lactate dehydrogenase [Arenicella chitinivorans]|uniref:Lactate dehydrogenase n=1 Tax=Arenicella chitinivorans TaxID=1329800 RepID=A0A918RQP2_9GAMM|nr:D-2-hydroxyacid dehydrogenase [Arenicella chitinivorans]GHA09396.1 lactate dehydrogenase [Arenicella chitinivorans]